MTVLLAFLAALDVLLPRVSMTVSSRIVTAGNQLRIECRVPHDERNRRLRISLDDWSSTERDIDMRSSVIQAVMFIAPRGVDEAEARCTLGATDGLHTARMTIIVVDV